MKVLILRLMEIEEKAQMISDEARTHLENIDAELAAAGEKKSRELEERAEKRIGLMRAEAEENLQKRLAELDEKDKADKAALEKHFEENFSRWSKSIYDEIIAL